MRRGTTPTITLTVTNDDNTPLDLTNDEVYITFKESGTNGTLLTKNNVWR